MLLALLAGCAPAPTSPATPTAAGAPPTTAAAAPTGAAPNAASKPTAPPAAAAGTAPTAAPAAPAAAPGTASTPAGAAGAAPTTGAARAYTPTPLSPAVHLRVVDGQTSSNLPVYLAYDRGYFTAEGLDVELQVLNDNSASVQSVATNQVQFIMTLADPVVFNAIDRGINIKLLASSTVNGPTDKPAAFLVRQDLIDSGQVKTPADLRGLNVAVPSAASSFYADRYLRRGGLTLDDVKVVTLPAPETAAAFATHSVDAAWEGEPVATSLNTQGLARSVAYTGELLPNAVAVMLIMAPQFGEQQPEAARRFVIAYLRGARDYYFGFMKGQGDRAAIIQSLINHTSVKDPKLYDLIGLPSVDPNANVDPTPSWSVFQDFYVARGFQQHKVELEPYVDFSYINHALDVLGRV
jgi:NitT/TauT family transport system substrate-binding protein